MGGSYHTLQMLLTYEMIYRSGKLKYKNQSGGGIGRLNKHFEQFKNK
jgi:hypothetical protein